MKVLLMNPISIYSKWPTDPDLKFTVNCPSVSLVQLAATLPSHSVKILDGLEQDIGIKNFKKKVKKFDIVGINSHSTISALNTELNVRLIKKSSPETKIILGGNHATIFHTRWVERGVDFVVRREGEITLPELVETVEKDGDLSKVNGITYRDAGGKAQVNPERPFIKDLDELPMPRWDLMDLKKYNVFYSEGGLTASVETSRGCTFKCNFCWVSPMWNNTQRFKSAGRVIEEIELLTGLGANGLFIVDDNFGVNYKRDMEIYSDIIKENLDIRWGSFMRVDSVLKHHDMIKLAGKSGCRLALVGFESTRWDNIEKCDKKYPKDITLESYRQAYSILRENGILVCGLLMTGFIDESDKDADNVFNELLEGERFCDYYGFNLLKPLPGTPLYDKVESAGLLTKDMFYHDYHLAAIDGQKNISNKRNQFFIQKQITQIKDLLFGRDVDRKYFFHRYKCLLAGIIGINSRNFSDFLESKRNRNLPDQKRQDMIVHKYLNDDFINKL